MMPERAEQAAHFASETAAALLEMNVGLLRMLVKAQPELRSDAVRLLLDCRRKVPHGEIGEMMDLQIEQFLADARVVPTRK